MPQITKPLTLKDLPAPPPGKVGWPWTKQSAPVGDRMPNGSEWPCISIVTPSYNQGQFIEETIRSVLLQGYPNLEYVVIDGSSTDDTVEILKKYEPFLAYWASEKDRGQTHAINKGLTKTSGSILGWINSDDLYVKGTLKKISKAFHQYQSHILVHGNRILINEASEVTGWAPLPSFDPKTTPYTICSETAFWRRSVMEKVGSLNEDLHFAMDLEFFGRLYLYGKFLKMDNYLGCFRCYSSNKSSTIPHICQVESEREWKRLFGNDFPNSCANKNYFLLLKDLIKNPILIAGPYVIYKIFRGFRFARAKLK
jgi:glycosyltransferase involved in cell wall biosynthesis